MVLGNLLEEYRRRGLVQDCSDEPGLYAHLGSRVTAYLGFDPVADSLTVGHLIPLAQLRLLVQSGHRAIILTGGGTGLVGDPSGKARERPLVDEEEIERNIAGQLAVISKFVDLSDRDSCSVMNNATWLKELTFLDAMREGGRYLSAFSMFQRDSVQSRRESGMSYAEFSYQFMQAYDFAHMHSHYGVTLQVGGSDQWGNMLAGLELIRKRAIRPVEAFAVTSPLLLDGNGQKMGKSALTSVWLSKERTSPYELYQYFINLDDRTASDMYLRIAERDLADVVEEIEVGLSHPEMRLLQKAIAKQVITRLYGSDLHERCERASRIVFSKALGGLSQEELSLVIENLPVVTVSKSALMSDGLDISGVAQLCNLAESRSEARRLIEVGGLAINGEVVREDRSLVPVDFLHGHSLLLRRGVKTWKVIRLE